jgi:hypothetical protein
LKLLDFCDGGAVLKYLLTGATDRSGAARSAGRAINRGAARNMMLRDVKQKRDAERDVADVNGTRKCRHYVKVMGPAFLSGKSRDLRR